ncbi:MAG: hypothetical protein ACR2PI_00915 [Hyphomicrobiaceae bacterium]
MAMIIRLERMADSTQDVAEVDGSCRQEDAEVILFPGIRYERWSDATTASAGSPEIDGKRVPVRSRRDWLDI